MKNPFASITVAIYLGAFLISFSILLSSGIIRIKGLTTNFVGTQGTQNAPTAPAAPGAPEAPTGPVKISVDDDPIIGSKDAPVTMVEFSDYECPFCKRHFEQSYTQLKKDYIDTGKVKLVFRDLPLPFHEPMASVEANAASCAREQGGDEMYFKFHDELFKRTASNGNGLTKDAVYAIGTDLGLNVTNLKSCTDSEKYKAEIVKDTQDANSIGATGTPSFVVGKSGSGKEIEGNLIIGAVPYSQFQTEIDALLK